MSPDGEGFEIIETSVEGVDLQNIKIQCEKCGAKIKIIGLTTVS